MSSRNLRKKLWRIYKNPSINTHHHNSSFYKYAHESSSRGGWYTQTCPVGWFWPINWRVSTRPVDVSILAGNNQPTDTSIINHLVANNVTRAVAPITVTSATPPVAPVGMTMTKRRDWIREGVQTRDIDMESQCHNDARIGLIPKPQVPPFEGGNKGIIQFPAFSAHFKDFVHDVLSCDPTKLSILRAYLPATVQEEMVSKEWDRRYNLPHLVAEYYLQELLEIKPIARHDRSALVRFCRKAMSTLKTLESIGRTVDVSPIILTQLTAKLTRHKQEQWGSMVYELQRQDPPRIADNKDFYDFLERITGTEEVLSFRSDVQKPAREERNTRATVLVTSSLSPSDGSTDRECTICQGKHRIDECKKFQNLPIESRFGAVKERKLCFRFLKPNHLSRECKSKKVCGTENCRAKHNFLLHNAPRLEARAETKSLDAPNPPVQSQDSAILTTTEAVRSPPSTLPTVPVLIMGPKRVEVITLLDAGSMVSLIDQRLCHKL